MMSDKDDIDAIVKEYLLARGYSKAAAELEQESHIVISEDNQLSSSASNNRSLSHRILSTMAAIAEESSHLGLKQSNSDMYITNYDSLRSWALSSLDIIKPQLISLCFPVFVHCYIGLIGLQSINTNSTAVMETDAPVVKQEEEEGYSDEERISPAKLLWDRWSADYSESFSDELASLSTLTAACQLQSEDFLLANPFISCALRGKFLIRLTGVAYRVLTAFLLESGLTVVAAIANTRLRFVRLVDSEGAADDEHQQGPAMELENYTPESRDNNASSAVPGTGAAAYIRTVTLGVPGRGAAGPVAKGGGGGLLSVPDTREDPVFREWLSRLVRPQAILSGTTAAVTTGKRVRSDAELSGQDSTAADTSYADLSRRLSEHTNDSSGRSFSRTPVVAKGSASDPSIIFATATNSQEGMTCMHINAGVTQAATGHRDSCVRVWRLDGGSAQNSEAKPRFGRSLPRGRSGWEFDEVLPKPRDKFGTAVNGDGDRHNGGGGGGDDSAFDPNLLELRGHTMPVFGVSQDGSDRLVLSCSADETIRLWDVAVAQCVGRYNCVSPAWGVAFSPLAGGYYFAAASQDKTVTLFSTDRVAPVRMMTGHTSDATCLAWHPNGAYLCSGSDDKTARLWDIRSGSSARLLAGSATPLSCVAVCADGHLVAAGSDSGVVYLWDLAAGRQLAVLQGHSGPVHSVNFSDDNSALVSGGADCSVRVWELSTLPLGDSGPVGGARERVVLCPRHSFFTKFSPVFYAHYTPQNLVYAGGPFSMTAATRYRESLTNNSATISQTVDNVSSEHETVSALGISRAVVSRR